MCDPLWAIPFAAMSSVGHAGFLGGKYGQSGEPAGFAARLRDILAEGV